LPDLNQDCEQVLTHPHGNILERISGSKATGIPLNEAAVRARSDMVSVLACWSKMVAEERWVNGPELREIAALVSFLTMHLDWLAAHLAARDFVDEITGLARAARQAAYPDSRFIIELGPCVQPGCESILQVSMRGDDDLPPNSVRCCAGHAWLPHQWLLLDKRMEQIKRNHSKDRLEAEELA
jgi:hypothetical protein